VPPTPALPVAPQSVGRWLRFGLTAVGALGAGALAAIAGSVAVVRRTAAGHLFTASDVPPAPVALVLGAQVYPDGTPSPFLTARLDLAKQLYDAGRVRAILVSGDNMAPEYDEPDAMRTYLIKAGVPSTQVIADYAGFDTYDSCVRAKKIFGVDELIVVTQRYHLPRAVATCILVGVTANGVGDVTVRRFLGPWRSGAIRDQVACVKTMIDLLTDRQPILGPRETSVDSALAH
jgi:vancomycin permeability regulator SanA